MYTDHLEMVFIVLGVHFFMVGICFWLSLVNQKNEGDDFYGGGKIIQLFFNKWFCKTEWI